MLQTSPECAQTLFGPTNLNFDAGNKSATRNQDEPLPSIVWDCPCKPPEKNEKERKPSDPFLIQTYCVEQNQDSDNFPDIMNVKWMRKNSSKRKGSRIFLAVADHKNKCFVPYGKGAPEGRLFAPLPKPFEYHDYANQGFFLYNAQNESQLMPHHIWFDLTRKKPFKGAEEEEMPWIGMLVWPLPVWDAFVIPFNPFDLSSSNWRTIRANRLCDSLHPRKSCEYFPAHLVSDELLAHVALILFSDTKISLEMKQMTRFKLWKMCCDEINCRFFM